MFENRPSIVVVNKYEKRVLRIENPLNSSVDEEESKMDQTNMFQESQIQFPANPFSNM